MELMPTGEKIRRLREKLNLSQKRFATKIGISPKTVSAYETGKIQPTQKVLERIYTTYNTSIVTMPTKQMEQILNSISEMELKLEKLREVLR